MKLLKSKSGFTLVELMVVVAIIGILSAVAVPNFKKYQAKSKTSEAKLQLSALYMSQAAFYSDFNTYGTCLNIMGFDPAPNFNNRVYAVGMAAGIATPAATGAPAACQVAGAVNNGAVSVVGANFAYGQGKVSFGVNLLAATLTPANVPGLITPTAVLLAGTAVIPAAFTAGALGVVGSSNITAGTADAWTINEAKTLANGRIGY